jgi:hypothetical protein
MNKKRRVILRTETFERITLRQSSKIINHETLTLGFYRIEISKVDAKKEQIVFEAIIHGFIEITETDEEIRFVYLKRASR